MPAAPVAVDVEAAVAAWLRTALGAGHRVMTEAPADLAQVLPAHRVVRLGGADRDVVFDRATVDVDTWAADRIGARAAALSVHTRIRFALPGQRVPGGVVCAVDTLTGPAFRPWDDTGIRRFGATYQILVQAQS